MPEHNPPAQPPSPAPRTPTLKASPTRKLDSIELSVVAKSSPTTAFCLGRPAIVHLPWVSARSRRDSITTTRNVAQNRLLYAS